GMLCVATRVSKASSAPSPQSNHNEHSLQCTGLYKVRGTSQCSGTRPLLPLFYSLLSAPHYVERQLRLNLLQQLAAIQFCLPVGVDVNPIHPYAKPLHCVRSAVFPAQGSTRELNRQWSLPGLPAAPCRLRSQSS